MAHQGSTGGFLLLRIFSDVVWHPGLFIAGQLIVSASPRFLFILEVMIYCFLLPNVLRICIYEGGSGTSIIGVI